MAQRATSLGPKPSSLFVFLCLFFVFLLCFPFFASNRKTVFPLKKGIFTNFLCLSLFLFSLCLASPFFTFLFLCLSLGLFFLPSCFSCKFLVLAFCFCLVCFLLQDVLLFLFFCLLSCFVLNHNSIVFPLQFFLVVVLCFCFFGALLFLNFGYLSKNISQTIGNSENPQMKLQKNKTNILTRTFRTGVFTNSVFSFIFCVSLKFCNFAESTIQIGVSAKNKNKKN